MHFERLIDELLMPNDDGEIMKYLKEFKADGGLALQTPLEVMILKKLNLPVMNYA